MFNLDSRLRKEIIRRDGSCYDCLTLRWLVTKIHLHVHHIKTRWSGGTHAYNNLITLCHIHHTIHAHGTEQNYHQKRYEAYTAWFTEPEWWQDAIKEQLASEMQRKHTEKHYRKVAAEAQKKWFVKKHGTTPSKLAYKKQKEYLQKQIEKIKWM